MKRQTIKNQILELKYMIIKKFTRTVQEKNSSKTKESEL